MRTKFTDIQSFITFITFIVFHVAGTVLSDLCTFHVYCLRKVVCCPQLGARIHMSRTVKVIIFYALAVL